MFGLSALGVTLNDPRSLAPAWLDRRAKELFVQTTAGKWINRPPRPANWQPASLSESVRLLWPEDIQAIRIPTTYLHNAGQSHWSEETVSELASLNPEWVKVTTIPGPKDNPSVFVSSAAPHLFLMAVYSFLAELP